MYTITSIGTLIVSILALILAVLALLVPVFIVQIRNRLIKTNKQLDQIISLMGGTERTVTCPGCGGTFRIPLSPGTVKCPHCGKQYNSDILR